MLKRVWRRLGWTSVTSVRESHCLYLSNEDNKRFSIVRRGLWIPNVCYPITCYRNVCNMSLVSFSSAVIFIIRSLIVLQVRVCPVVSRRRLQNTQVVIGQPSDTPSTVRPHPGGDRSTVGHPFNRPTPPRWWSVNRPTPQCWTRSPTLIGTSKLKLCTNQWVTVNRTNICTRCICADICVEKNVHGAQCIVLQQEPPAQYQKNWNFLGIYIFDCPQAVVEFC